jgi:hypothetical protein
LRLGDRAAMPSVQILMLYRNFSANDSAQLHALTNGTDPDYNPAPKVPPEQMAFVSRTLDRQCGWGAGERR